MLWGLDGAGARGPAGHRPEVKVGSRQQAKASGAGAKGEEPKAPGLVPAPALPPSGLRPLSLPCWGLSLLICKEGLLLSA